MSEGRDFFTREETVRRVMLAGTQLELSLGAETARQLLDYLAQMQRWNRTYNLTAIRDPEQMLIQHLFDSLAVVAPLRAAVARQTVSVYDVGSGGGLPGVVLAIMCPDWQISCIDAVEKKTAFVRQISNIFALSNLQAQHARVETLPPGECQIVISRAFAALQDFASLAGTHVCQTGRLVAMKGKPPTDEIQALHAAGSWQLDRLQSLHVPELQAERCLVWMRHSQGSQ